MYSTNDVGKIVYPYIKERDYIPISDLEEKQEHELETGYRSEYKTWNTEGFSEKKK